MCPVLHRHANVDRFQIAAKRQAPESKNQTLGRLYYSPESPGSFGGAQALWRTVKAQNLHDKDLPRPITYTDIQKFLSTQRTYSLFKPTRRRFPKNRSLPIPGPNYLLAADIWQLSRFTELEKRKSEKAKATRKGKPETQPPQFYYVLVAIDGFSKRICCVPMVDKTQESVASALEQLVNAPANFRFKVFFTDQDRSFLGQKTQEWLRKRKIAHVCSATQLHCFMAERAILTLSRKLRRLMYYSRSYNWTRQLADVVSSYNNTPHSQLVNGKYSPNEVTVFNAPEIYNYMYHGPGATKGMSEKQRKKMDPKFALGDQVLLARPKELFRKSYEPSYQPEYFTVDRAMHPTRPGQTRPTYRLRDTEGNLLKGRFYNEQLQKVYARN